MCIVIQLQVLSLNYNNNGEHENIGNYSRRRKATTTKARLYQLPPNNEGLLSRSVLQMERPPTKTKGHILTMHTLTTTSIETWLRWMINSDLEPSIFTTPKGLNIYVLTKRS